MEGISPIELNCVMKILGKPQLQNSIVVSEFLSIMSNYGIDINEK